MKPITKGTIIRSDIGILNWTVTECPNEHNEYYILESSVANIPLKVYYRDKVILADVSFILRSHRVITCKSIQAGLGKVENWLKDELDLLNRISSEYIKLFDL